MYTQLTRHKSTVLLRHSLFWKLRIVWLSKFRNGQRCYHINMGPTGCQETSATNVLRVTSKNCEGLDCAVRETVLSQQFCFPLTFPSGPRSTSNPTSFNRSVVQIVLFNLLFILVRLQVLTVWPSFLSKKYKTGLWAHNAFLHHPPPKFLIHSTNSDEIWN